MTHDDFRSIEQDLAASHAEMAFMLGVSEVSIKRYATGAQPVPPHIAKLVIAQLLLQSEGLQKKFSKLLAKYHCDT